MMMTISQMVEEYRQALELQPPPQYRRPGDNGPCTLYRHFGADGQLLYIGIANDPIFRLHTHERSSKWRGLITTVTIERFRTRTEARLAEAAAIKTESPLYNITHNLPEKFRFETQYIDLQPQNVPDTDKTTGDSVMLNMPVQEIEDRCVNIRLSIKDLAERAGYHSNTVKALLMGKSVHPHTRIAIVSAIMQEELRLRDYLMSLHPLETKVEAAE